MATKEIAAEVQVSLDDFDVDDIIEHLRHTHLSRRERRDLIDVLNEYPDINIFPDHPMFENLGDQLKWEVVEEAMEKYSIDELQKRLA